MRVENVTSQSRGLSSSTSRSVSPWGPHPLSRTSLTVSVCIVMVNVFSQQESPLESAPEEKPLVGRREPAKFVDRCREPGRIVVGSCHQGEPDQAHRQPKHSPMG